MMISAKALTCSLVFECIPLHHSISDITADKVLAVAKKYPVPNSVNVWRREVGNASVAGVLAVVGWPVAKHLLADLHVLHCDGQGMNSVY